MKNYTHEYAKVLPVVPAEVNVSMTPFNYCNANKRNLRMRNTRCKGSVACLKPKGQVMLASSPRWRSEVRGFHFSFLPRVARRKRHGRLPWAKAFCPFGALKRDFQARPRGDDSGESASFVRLLRSRWNVPRRYRVFECPATLFHP
jgi:hypothetical protein